MGLLIGGVGLFIGSMGLFVGRAVVRALVYFSAFFRFTNPFCALRMQTSKTPTLAPLSLSHLCATYLRVQFQNKLNARSSGAPATPLAEPLMLPVALASELDIIAATLANAFFNRSR